MDHAYFIDRLSALFDNELPPQEKQVVEEHLRGCAECQAALAKLQQLEDAVKRHSQLADTDYWEESAQKIERQLGFDQQTVITPIRHRWYERGLGWKALAAVASIAVLAYIGINSDKILKQRDLAPSPTPAEEKRIETPQVSPVDVPHADTVAPQKAEPTKKPLEVIRDAAVEKRADTAVGQVRVKDQLADVKKMAPPAPASQDINLSQRMAPVTAKQPEQQILNKFETASMPERRAVAAPTALSAESNRVVPIPDTAARIVEEEADNVSIAQVDTAAVDSTLTWWRKKRDALETVRKTLPGVDAFSGLSKMAAPTKLRSDDKKQPQMTPTEVEKQLLEAWYNVARLTRDAGERDDAVAEIRKVAEGGKSANHAAAVDYLRELGVR